MKIIFICGSLEPGRDGVGDYTRRLAASLLKKGILTQITAINDIYIEQEISGFQMSDGVSVPILRIPSRVRSNDRFLTFSWYISNFEPDLLSLQFVPFSFHPKGMPINLYKHLINLGSFKWHIMFHELWVGAYGSTSLKLRFLGLIQEIIIKNLLKSLDPAYATTHSEVFRRKLNFRNVELLPLFGNIPIANTSKEMGPESESLVAVHFGSFTGSLLEFERQILCLADFSSKLKRDIIIQVIGKGGAYKANALKIIERVLGKGSYIDLGTLPEDQISNCLYHADIGISKASFPLYSKSGSTIAMLEHGLPVLLRDMRPRINIEDFFRFDKQLIFFDDDQLYLNKNNPREVIDHVSDMFLKEIKDTLYRNG